MSKSPWPNFNYNELRCRCGRCSSDGTEMDPRLMDQVQKLRDLYGKAMTISSPYRCPKHPSEARKAHPGVHAEGLAIDIACAGAEAVTLLRLAMTLPFTGIGIQQKGSGRFLHLDMATPAAGRPRPTIWSY
jgi:uncharacterized protein YcbK (DUF882 family)